MAATVEIAIVGAESVRTGLVSWERLAEMFQRSGECSPDEEIASFKATLGGINFGVVKRQQPPERALEANQSAAAHVSDAGTHLIIAGPSQVSVLSALEELTARGAKVLSPISKVGKRWIASCEHPTTAGSGCTVEVMGALRLVVGPTREGVLERLEQLLRSGARLVRDAESSEKGVWMAVCEIVA